MEDCTCPENRQTLERVSCEFDSHLLLDPVVHGWNKESKSTTACGLGWIYGRRAEGKEPLEMVTPIGREGVTCKRCLKSKNLREK